MLGGASTAPTESRGARYGTQPIDDQHESALIQNKNNTKKLNVKKAYIVREDVQRAVITECLLLHAVPEVVLGDEVARARVQAPGEEAAGDKVDERPRAEGRDERVVEDELDDDVENVPAGQTLAANECGAEGVEEDLEGAGRGRR